MIRVNRADVTLHAWIHSKTRYPVAVGRNETVFAYQYLPDPTTGLTPPDTAVAAVQKEADRVKRLLGAD